MHRTLGMGRHTYGRHIYFAAAGASRGDHSGGWRAASAGSGPRQRHRQTLHWRGRRMRGRCFAAMPRSRNPRNKPDRRASTAAGDRCPIRSRDGRTAGGGPLTTRKIGGPTSESETPPEGELAADEAGETAAGESQQASADKQRRARRKMKWKRTAESASASGEIA